MLSIPLECGVVKYAYDEYMLSVSDQTSETEAHAARRCIRHGLIPCESLLNITGLAVVLHG
jgi:hypothetical protein